jgi:hypothetical protein
MNKTVHLEQQPLHQFTLSADPLRIKKQILLLVRIFFQIKQFPVILSRENAQSIVVIGNNGSYATVFPFVIKLD